MLNRGCNIQRWLDLNSYFPSQRHFVKKYALAIISEEIIETKGNTLKHCNESERYLFLYCVKSET